MKAPDVGAATAFLRGNAHAARLSALTLTVVALSAWTSCAARTTERDATARIEEAATVRESATRFSSGLVAATSGEIEEWSRTTEEAAEFGSAEEVRFSLAQTVSRIAEVAGMSGVRASFVPSDSVVAAGARSVGDLVFQPSSYGLRLEGSGSVAAIARTVLRLPPATEIASLSISGDNQLRATFLLSVYKSSGGGQN